MKQILLILAVSVMLTSCYKTQGPEYYDEMDITMTKYDVNFDFGATKTIVVSDTVILRHDYLTDAQVTKFFSRGGTSDQIVSEIKRQFRAKGYEVKGSGSMHTEDSTFFKTADLYLNPTVMLSETTEYYYYPGYGWGWGYYGYYGYYGVNPFDSDNTINTLEHQELVERSADYYYYPYYPGYWGGGYGEYTYQTGTIVLEMGEGESVRDYWLWYSDKSRDDIDLTPPEQLPQIEFVWHAFIEAIVSGDNSYDEDRAKRGFDEAFEQSYYLNK